MSNIEVQQIVTNGIHNVVVLKVKDNSGKTVYAVLDAYTNMYTATDAARMKVRGY